MSRRLHPRAWRSRGTVYVAALGLGLLVVTIGTGAMASARVWVRSSSLTSDAAAARSMAQGAIQQVRVLFAGSEASRASAVGSARSLTGQVTLPGSGGKGRTGFSVLSRAPDAGGASVYLMDVSSQATVGSAKQRLSVVLEPVRTPLTCLETCAYSASSIAITGGSIAGSGQIIHGAGLVTSTLSSVEPNIEAGSLGVGLLSSGKVRSGVSPRQVPTAAVLDYYISIGTPIDGDTFSGDIKDILLSPTSNPYGVTNPLGVYVLNARGRSIDIKDARIIGTVVVINPPSVFKVTNSVAWETARPGFPALLVRGNVEIDLDNKNLSESKGNFNPSGAAYPFPGGVSNTTQVDQYTSSINGLVFATGTMRLRGDTTLHSAISAGVMTLNGKLIFTRDERYRLDPPPGFYNAQMTPQRGSWRLLTDKAAEAAAAAEVR